MREKTQSKQVGARARSAALTPEARTRIAAHLYSVIAFMRASSNWQPGVLASMLNQAFANLLHYNTYIFTGRTAPTVCEPAADGWRPIMQTYCQKLNP